MRTYSSLAAVYLSVVGAPTSALLSPGARRVAALHHNDVGDGKEVERREELTPPAAADDGSQCRERVS